MLISFRTCIRKSDAPGELWCGASKSPEARNCEVTVNCRSGGRIGVVRSTSDFISLEEHFAGTRGLAKA
jgi:hypothetical protein